jgi:hypothetical protein
MVLAVERETGARWDIGMIGVIYVGHDDDRGGLVAVIVACDVKFINDDLSSGEYKGATWWNCCTWYTLCQV